MRALLLATLFATAAGCTLSPDVSEYEPKTDAQCPGQKACGYRCVDVDDPAAGCTATGCEPCAAPAANSAAICVPGNTCALACASGFADCNGDLATGATGDGCETPVSADAANCGACGHSCGVNACVAGECQTAVATVVSQSGEQPRGIAVAGTTLAWVTDPPVAGGVAPAGVLYRAPIAGGTGTATTGFAPGHGTWVTAATGQAVVVSGTEDTYGYYDCWLVDGTGTVTDVCGWRDYPALGVANAEWATSIDRTGWDVYTQHLVNPWSGTSNYGEELYSLARGAGFVWVGAQGGVYRRTEGDAVNWPEGVSGGGTYFAGLPVTPRPDRVAARSEATGDVKVIYFVDLTDGSVWTGRTTGAGNNPWRLVRGDGPRTQMDVAADADGAVWSDYDRGEIWAVDTSGQVFKLASGVRPWAIALTATTVYFTDVDAQAIRSVAR